jgi:hypothetical protein
MCLSQGISISKNFGKAFSLFSQSDKYGYSRAICGLNYCYEYLKEFKRIQENESNLIRDQPILKTLTQFKD